MKAVLITGGAGFIGCNLARYLRRMGYRVFAADNLSLGLAANLPVDIPLLVGDVGDEKFWGELPEVAAIVHLAGASSTPMFATDLPGSFQNNVVGFLRVLEHARKQGVRRVIYASTSLIYGNVSPPLSELGPVDTLNLYAVSKYCMEQIAHIYHRENALQVIGLRLMSVYGPREDHKRLMANLVSQFIWAIEKGESPIVYGDGTQTRDFTSVWDVAQAVKRVLEYPGNLSSKVFNVGTGIPTSVNALIELLAQIMKAQVKAHYISIPSGRAYNYHQYAKLDLIKTELGYQPLVSLQEGIEEIWHTRTMKIVQRLICRNQRSSILSSEPQVEIIASVI